MVESWKVNLYLPVSCIFLINEEMCVADYSIVNIKYNFFRMPIYLKCIYSLGCVQITLNLKLILRSTGVINFKPFQQTCFSGHENVFSVLLKTNGLWAISTNEHFVIHN